MKKKDVFVFTLITASIGFLLYSYFYSDVRYGMMGHHYGYYEGYNGFNHYLNSVLIFTSYTVLIICTLIILNRKKPSINNSLKILDERLSNGEISIEEYQAIKKELM